VLQKLSNSTVSVLGIDVAEQEKAWVSDSVE
jgi:hypothetical protein